MRKILHALAVLLMISLLLCGAASAEDIPVPAFSVPESFQAGAPIVIIFPEGLPAELGAQVSVYNQQTGSSLPSYSIYGYNLDSNNSFVVVDEGLDAGEYRVEVRGIQTSPLMSGTAVSTVYFSVYGTRPQVPAVEIISNNAPWRGENEIRITSPGITGFILYAYDSEDRMSWSTLTPEDPEDEAAMAWTQESEDVISVRLNRKRSNTTDNWYTVAAVVNGIASPFTEDAVHLTWQEEEKDPAPEFFIEQSLKNGQPVGITFPDGIPDGREVEVDIYKGSDYNYILATTVSSYGLDENNHAVLLPSGLEAGEYRIEVYFYDYWDGEWISGEKGIVYFSILEAPIPDAPTLEVVVNNAQPGMQNEIRISAENISSFILYESYYDEEYDYDYDEPVPEGRLEWVRESDSAILVKVSKPYDRYSAGYSASVAVDDIYSKRSEQVVTLTWQNNSSELVMSENLHLGHVTTELNSNRTMLNISGIVNGPENVAQIRIASWQDSKPTASDARASAQTMTDIWKESGDSFSEREVPFFFGTGRPVSASDLGKTQYIILAGLDTEVNLVGYAVVQVKLPDPALTPITIELPSGVDVPSLEECKAYNGWDQVNTDEYSSVFYMNPRANLPYRMSVQFVNGQTPGVGFEVDVTGTEADPRADKENPVGYNALQIHYWDGETDPSMVWTTTSYNSVAGLFDHAYIVLYYGSDFESITSGFAMLGINSNTVRVDFRYGWQITDDVRTAFSAGGLLEDRLTWLNAYQPKPLTVRKTDRLSIYDLIGKSKALYLPASLQKIESQAFIGIDAEKVIIPASVQTIADDAFDDEILLILPDTRLENWAKEHHPNYRIGQ